MPKVRDNPSLSFSLEDRSHPARLSEGTSEETEGGGRSRMALPTTRQILIQPREKDKQ